MNYFPRYFVFGRLYSPGDDYVRCDRPRRSMVVAPGGGEVLSGEELTLERCLAFVRQGVMCETNEQYIGKRPFLITRDPRRATGQH